MTDQIFVSPHVQELFTIYLSNLWSVSPEDIQHTLDTFTNSLIKFHGRNTRREIIASFREVFGLALDRYTDSDILGWVCPYPAVDLIKLADHCVVSITKLDIVSPSWGLDANLAKLKRVIIRRIIQVHTHSDIWRLVYSVKKDRHLASSVDDMMKFVLARKNPKEELNVTKITKQLLLAFK